METIEGYQEQLVAYIDLLGFSETSFQNHEMKMKVLELLKGLSFPQGNLGESVTHSEPHPNGKGIIMSYIGGSAKPAYSSFSDNIIMSWPTNTIKLKQAIFTLEHYIYQFIALPALKAGFLIRGGITIGNLYHQDGVVYGEALVEAHKIESKIAKYPRIIISANLHEHLHDDNNDKNHPIKEDFDGLYYLDYLKNLLGNTREKDFVLELCSTSIATFRKNRDMKKLSYWQYFSNYFESTFQSKEMQQYVHSYEEA